MRPETLLLPWTSKPFVLEKGIIHQPASTETLSPKARDNLLHAIAKARRWVDDLSYGRVSSLAEIANKEGKVERHIRLLSALAFVSPEAIRMIMNGEVSADITITGLAKSLPHSWTDQVKLLTH